MRDQRVARAIDREVAPIWHDRFARLIWRNLPAKPLQMALDVHSGPGRTTAQLLARLEDSARIVALEPDAALRTLAKSRIFPEVKDRVYLKAGDMADVADMGEATYDLVVANLVLGEAHDLEEALRSLIRITKPGGEILATFPMAGTWQEAEDLFREVLRDAKLEDAARRLRRLGNLRLTGHEVARVVAQLGVEPGHFVIEQERFSLLFRSGREFLFSSLVEHGPLHLWKAIMDGYDKPQEIFWRLKEAVDAYFADHIFSVTAVAGLLRLPVSQPGTAGAQAAAETAAAYWRQYPELDALWRAREHGDVATAETSSDEVEPDVEEVDIDIDIDTDADAEPEPEPQVEATVPGEQADAATPSSAEDEAIFAALEQPQAGSPPDQELDALLDQVLEFASPANEEIEEIDEEALEEIETEEHRPGETLKRIRALIPPHPDTAPKPPPLPGRKRGRGGNR